MSNESKKMKPMHWAIIVVVLVAVVGGVWTLFLSGDDSTDKKNTDDTSKTQESIENVQFSVVNWDCDTAELANFSELTPQADYQFCIAALNVVNQRDEAFVLDLSKQMAVYNNKEYTVHNDATTAAGQESMTPEVAAKGQGDNEPMIVKMTFEMPVVSEDEGLTKAMVKLVVGDQNMSVPLMTSTSTDA